MIHCMVQKYFLPSFSFCFFIKIIMFATVAKSLVWRVANTAPLTPLHVSLMHTSQAPYSVIFTNKIKEISPVRCSVSALRFFFLFCFDRVPRYSFKWLDAHFCRCSRLRVSLEQRHVAACSGLRTLLPLRSAHLSVTSGRNDSLRGPSLW